MSFGEIGGEISGNRSEEPRVMPLSHSEGQMRRREFRGREKFFFYQKYLNHGWHIEVEKYDLMQQYEETIPVEEQDAIWREVGDQLEERDKDMRKVAAKRAFAKPTKRS